jgi:hypothetical protein
VFSLDVIDFEEWKTPITFVNSGSRFQVLDNGTQEVIKTEPLKKHIKSDTRLMNLLRQAVEIVAAISLMEM